MANVVGWGERFHRFISSADDPRRIWRGMSYAQSGAVGDLRIEKGIGTAVVHGNSTYLIRFSIPQFTAKERDLLVASLLSNPRLMDLLNRHIFDAYWEDFIRRQRISLFPESVSELGFSCSCPDSARLCKHMAAVIFHLSRLLEKDPFLLFEWKGLDLRKALVDRGVVMSTPVVLPELKRMTELLSFHPAGSYVVPACDVSLDLESIPNGFDALLALLPKLPSFYGSNDFREVYANGLRDIGIIASGMLERAKHGEPMRNLHAVVFSTDTDIRICLDYRFHVDVQVCSNGMWQPYMGNSFLFALEAIGEKGLTEYAPAVQWLWHSYRFLLYLIAKGMLQARWVELEDGRFAAIWYASPLSSEVRALYADWEARFPAGILCDSKGDCAVRQPGAWVLSALMRLFLSTCSYHRKNAIDNVFFSDILVTVTKGHASVPQEVQAWLDHQSLPLCRYLPRLVVDECPTGFDLSLSMVDKEDFDGQPIAMDRFMREDAFAKDRMAAYDLFRALMYLEGRFQKVFNSGGTQCLHLESNGVAELLDRVFPALRLLGFELLLPKSLERVLLPKVVAKMGSWEMSDGSFRLNDLLDFDVRVALGDHEVSQKEFERMVSEADGFLRYQGQYFRYDQSLLNRMRGLFERKARLSTLELLASAVDGSFEGVPVVMSDGLRQRITQLTQVESVALPDNLNATLRPYQVRGYEWLYKNAQCGLGSILADDMGLGKTLQVIAFLLKVKQERGGRFLVVVPTGLLTNWKREVERFAPSLSVAIYHGPKRDLSLLNQDIVLTSYGTVRSDTVKLSACSWDVLVIDEAQQIKNPKAAQSKAVMGISAKVRIAMSGTPVENRLSELWAIMHFANPGFLGSLVAFTERFVNPIQKGGDKVLPLRLRKMMAPFVMRRLKSDKRIINDLPDKVERNEYATLVPKQAALYQSVLNKAMRAIEELPEGGDHRMQFKRKGLVLQMIMALKQVCNHPAQYLKAPEADANASGKMMLLLELVDQIVESGEKVLVFTQYRDMGTLLTKALGKRFGHAPLFYHGGLNRQNREEIVRRFQEENAEQVLVVTLKAAGTGLNLTAASHVIHYDLWWNPAVENQATDRAYRIGQHKNVQVHRFITEGTFEERIDALIAKKQGLADLTVASGEQWIGNLSNKELKELFAS